LSSLRDESFVLAKFAVAHIFTCLVINCIIYKGMQSFYFPSQSS
jgi:hypothetical protein